MTNGELQPEAPRPKIDFRYLSSIVSLPDNVFLLHPKPEDEPEPPQTMELAA